MIPLAAIVNCLPDTLAIWREVRQRYSDVGGLLIWILLNKDGLIYIKM